MMEKRRYLHQASKLFEDKFNVNIEEKTFSSWLDQTEPYFVNRHAYKFNHTHYKPSVHTLSTSMVLDTDNHDWPVFRYYVCLGETYYITVRVFIYKFETKHYEFKTCGTQIIFKYVDEKSILDKMGMIRLRVMSLLEAYVIEESNIIYVQLSVKRINMELLSDIQIDKEHLTKTDKTFYNKMVNRLPLTTESEVLGKWITDVKIENRRVVSVLVEIDGEVIDLSKRKKH